MIFNISFGSIFAVSIISLLEEFEESEQALDIHMSRILCLRYLYL